MKQLDFLMSYPEVSKQLLPVLGVTGIGCDEELWELLEGRGNLVRCIGTQERCSLEGCMRGKRVCECVSGELIQWTNFLLAEEKD